MMVRSLYSCLLRLHPLRFRQRFGEEMLSIFDQAAADRGSVTLLADAFLSVLRQWALRSEFWGRPVATGSVAQCFDGVPAFYTCASYRPQTAALLNGVVLSIAVFGAICFAIGHGARHHPFAAATYGSRHAGDWSPPVLPRPALPTRDLASAKSGGHLSGPLSSTEPPFSRSQPQPLFPKTLAPTGLARPYNAAWHVPPLESLSNDAARAFASVYFRVNRLLAALDADHDFVISASEIAGAPASIRQLDRNHDGKLSRQECVTGDLEFSATSVFSALDADHNGEISATEIQNASAALRTLDKNGDGRLTLDEILPDGVPR